MAVTVSGMFGNGKTYFADSPVVIDISGLEWPTASPFNIVKVEVIYNSVVVGYFRVDSNRQTTMSFNISSALRTIWAGYNFAGELAAAANPGSYMRSYRAYSLRVYTQYLASDGEYTETDSGEIAGGRCALGGLTEWERDNIGTKENADVSHLEHTNPRYGDASTKPVSSPERVGRESITSWVDVMAAGTKSIFYAASATPQPDDTPTSGWTGHAPMVLRDSIPYHDFLFVNRRGAVETCSALMKEAMDITVETQQYSRTEGPSFKPNRTLMAIAKGGRRSWTMSSGHLPREWAEWWTMEFLMARQWWMLYKGSYVPVIVEPAKKQTGIYDRTKQQMPSVEFTVTLALEG